MRRLKDMAMGLFMLAIGIAAFFQVVHVDPLWRYVAISAVSAISILAAAIFFIFSGNDR